MEQQSIDIAPQSVLAAEASKSTKTMDEEDVRVAVQLLGGSALFHLCSKESLQTVATRMEKRTYSRGQDIAVQGAVTDRFWLMADGYARRLRTDAAGAQRHVDTKACGNSISSLSIVSAEPTYATARCVTRSCTAYTLSRDELLRQLRTHPALATDVVASLSSGMRKKMLYRTPLLQQRIPDVNYVAVTIAASIESYYRSALNSVLNQRLSGVSSPLFPNMQVQIPARIMYITGFKGLRALFDRNIDTENLPNHPTRVAARFAVTVAPGIVMTPISGILEASNAGKHNPEPLLQRSLRGTLPRCGREVIFGIGLNQLSDYCEERYRSIFSSAVVANSAGSLTAGVIAGYFSHVPHNLSTFRLMNPTKSYREIFKMFVEKSAPEKYVPRGIPDALRNPLRSLMACIFPRGVLVRTTQICGSFVILNGTIMMIEKDQKRRMESTFEVASDDSPESSVQEPVDLQREADP